MQRLLKFSPRYFWYAVILFITEVLIAVFAHDPVIRPYVGDVLVVMLIYCFVKAFLNLPVFVTAICVLIFSYFIETLQYFHIVNRMGLKHSNLARTIIGTSFAWTDIVAYTLGVIIILMVEKRQYNFWSTSLKKDVKA